jgi:hypothetical protein
VIDGGTRSNVIALSPKSGSYIFRNQGGIFGMKSTTFCWSYNTERTPRNVTTLNIAVELAIIPTMEVDCSASVSLKPEVTEMEGFVEDRGMSIGVSSRKTPPIPLDFRQPVFSMREIQTEINAVDRATLAMDNRPVKKSKK